MSENIAEILAECLEAIENGTMTAAACLQKYPQYQTELKELFGTLQVVKSVPAVTPSLQFRQNAPARLLKKINAGKSPKPQKQRRKRTGFGLRKAATAALVVLIAFSATGVGAAYAASDDLPGDPLYGVKTTVEDLQLAFSDDEGDVGLLNKFANRRVDEIKALTEAGRFDDIPAAVQSFEKTNGKLGQAINDLAESDPGKAEALSATLEEARETRTDTLTELLDKLPEQAQKGIQNAINAGPPEDKGKPEDAGKPDDKGKPDNADCPQKDKGKPEDAGKPDDKGKPEDKDKSNKKDNNGDGNGNGNENGNNSNNGNNSDDDDADSGDEEGRNNDNDDDGDEIDSDDNQKPEC